MVRVSFIIPCLNSARTLAATLESILASNITHQDCEIIVVDNGSVDDTVKIASRYPVILTSCERRSASAARNHGARLAQGEFIAFLDSDVVIERDWLAELLKLFESGSYAAVLGRVIPVGPKNFLNDFRLVFNNRRYVGTNISLFHSGGIGPVINTAACIYRKNIFLALGGFDERMQRLEDSEFSGRLFSHGGTIYATRSARAYVTYAGGIFSYLWRSFKVGRGKFQVKSLANVGRKEIFIEFTKDLLNHDVSMFTLPQKIYFWLNMLMSYLGFLFSLPEKQISPNKPLLRLAGKILNQFLLSADHARYGLTTQGRFLRVDETLYFCSTKSGEWQGFEFEKVPWNSLEESGIVHKLSSTEAS